MDGGYLGNQITRERSRKDLFVAVFQRYWRALQAIGWSVWTQKLMQGNH
jgi:hypothetical protein